MTWDDLKGRSGEGPGQAKVDTLAASAMGGPVCCLRTGGEGATVILLHGIPDRADVWTETMARLSPTFHCLAPNLPGFGGSAWPRGFDGTLSRMADWVEAVAEAAGLREPVHLVVHDVGGVFGLAWAITRPWRVRRIGILNTAFFSDRRWHWGARVLRTPLLGEIAAAAMPRRAVARMLRRASNGNLSREQAASTAADFDASARRAATSLYRALSPAVFSGWESDLPALAGRAPAVVLWGARDPFLPSSFARRFHARRVHLYTDCGHWPHREAPERTARDLAAFLR